VRVLLLGKKGQLGWELQRTLAPLGSVVGLGADELNLKDFDAVRSTIRELRPRVIVNASAYTAVDRGESEPDEAYAINGKTPGLLAEEGAALKAVLIHFSTDYVFDGKKGAPYAETEVPNPLNTYGKSKLAGEEAIQAVGGNYMILRTAWVYSLRARPGNLRADNFVTKVLGWARQRETLRIVDDQISNPTWARMLAEATALTLVRSIDYVSERPGVYHLAGDGFTSRYAWAKEILKLDPNSHEQVIRDLLPAATADFPGPARRPLLSALDCTKFKSTFGLHLPDWRQSLELAIRG